MTTSHVDSGGVPPCPDPATIAKTHQLFNQAMNKATDAFLRAGDAAVCDDFSRANHVYIISQFTRVIDEIRIMTNLVHFAASLAAPAEEPPVTGPFSPSQDPFMPIGEDVAMKGGS